MVRVFVVLLVLMGTALLAWPVGAQNGPGYITIFADPTGTSCSIADQTPGPFAVYVLHTSFWRKMGVECQVVESAGFHATYLGESVTGEHSGDFRSGIRVNYGFCTDGTRLVGTIVYQGAGTSEPCSYLGVVGGWTHGSLPSEVDCSLGPFPAYTMGNLYVNPQPGICASCATVPTAPATWGKVKALYRN